MDSPFLPCTQALRRHLLAVTNERAIPDLLYLEAWEITPQPGAGSALRINQIRRANPELAAEIRAELVLLRAEARQMRCPLPRPLPPAARGVASGAVMEAGALMS